jgi:hypothetical protein
LKHISGLGLGRLPVAVCLLLASCSTQSPRQQPVPCSYGDTLVTVATVGEGKDAEASTQHIASILRNVGFTVATETPKVVIGQYGGTYLVPSTLACDRSECAKRLLRELHRNGFRTGSNPATPYSLNGTDEAPRTDCAFTILWLTIRAPMGGSSYTKLSRFWFTRLTRRSDRRHG